MSGASCVWSGFRSGVGGGFWSGDGGGVGGCVGGGVWSSGLSSDNGGLLRDPFFCQLSCLLSGR